MFDRTNLFRGEVFFQKPDLLRVNMLDDKGKPTETLVWEKRALHLLDFKARTEKIVPLSQGFHFPRKPGTYSNTMSGWVEGAFEWGSWFYVGPPVRHLESLFEVRLAKEDQYYVYIDVSPRTNADKATFQRARVVLSRDGLWMRQVWVENPNNSEILYDYEKPDTNPDPPITRERLLKDIEFLPPEWKRMDLRQQGQPPPPDPPK